MDTDTHTIVTHDVINQGLDREQLSPMALATKAALGRDTLHALADKGYFSGAEITACDKAGITVTMPRPETSGNRGKGMGHGTGRPDADTAGLRRLCRAEQAGVADLPGQLRTDPLQRAVRRA